MSVNRCPSCDQLRGYHLGTLPADALEWVAEHLEGCPACEAILRAFDSLGDSLIFRLRKSNDDPDRDQHRPGRGPRSLRLDSQN